YIVMDASGAGANVEAMATRSVATRLEAEPLAHTNHCLHGATRAVERPRDPASQQDSEARLADAERLLAREGLTVADLQADTANICHRGEAPRFVGTCGGVVMRPGTRELWAVRGRPSEEPYERFVVGAGAPAAGAGAEA